MIDLHCHVLPGIDDGPDTIEGSLLLARTAAAAGIHMIVATPHVNARYHNTAATIAALVRDVNASLAAEEVDVEVRQGAEIALTHAAEIEPAELSRLGLGGGPWLLIEPPFATVAAGLDSAVREIQRNGHRVLLAHPERCPAFHRDPAMLEEIVAAGALTSITAGSLVGDFGGTVQRFALELAADGHDPQRHIRRARLQRRPPGMAAALKRAGLAPLSEWLTRDRAGGDPRRRGDTGAAAAAPERRARRGGAAGRGGCAPGRERRGRTAPARRAARRARMIAITIPIATNTTIAICIHIHVGDIADSVAPSPALRPAATGGSAAAATIVSGMRTRRSTIVSAIALTLCAAASTMTMRRERSRGCPAREAGREQAARRRQHRRRQRPHPARGSRQRGRRRPCAAAPR